MYPTLSELAGLTLPVGTAGEFLGGTSLVPVLAGKVQQVKNATLSQFPRCWQNSSSALQRCGDENNNTNSLANMCDCHWASDSAIAFMGYSMRVHQPFSLRYTEWCARTCTVRAVSLDRDPVMYPFAHHSFCRLLEHGCCCCIVAPMSMT